MPSTFLGLNTGASGLNYYQAAINTTAHNISNADVTGYSRQKVMSKAADALRLHTAYGMLGTGVELTGIERQRNEYYDTKYWASTARYNEYEAQREQLSQLQSYLNEMQSEAGYTKLLNDLDAAMKTLASSPSDATYRTQFIQASVNFVDLIKEAAQNYQNTQQDINNEVALHVDTINSIASQIFTLNQQIMNIETRAGNASDLRDQREVLVDQLSELVNVTIVETPITYGFGENATKSGASRYEVRIGNTVLVDEMECRQLMVAARQEKINQNDLDGLYDVYWQGLNNTLGEKFNFNSDNVTGRIKGLLEVRDGNNANPFSGIIDSIQRTEKGEVNALVSVPEGVTMNDLNLPDEGIITLNCKKVYYQGWDAKYDSNGKLTEFTFKNLTVEDENGARVPAELDNSMYAGKGAVMGEQIDEKGIPYYMKQLNQFARTLSKYMNDLFTQGIDANGDDGLDFFTAHDIEGKDYVLKNATSDVGTTVTSTDASYYKITAMNWGINDAIVKDQNKLVVSTKQDIEQGNQEAKSILDRVIYGMSDRNMFAQGTPAQFLQAITTSQGVDISKYESFSKNIGEVANVINNQRLSVSSVETNEEVASLVMYKNGYDLASKVISVMNEVYDKLINQTGV